MTMTSEETRSGSRPTLPGGRPLIPGEIVHGDAPVELNEGQTRTTRTVINTGDRPIQVGSHYHFAAANPFLKFRQEQGGEVGLDEAEGMHLDVPAGTSVRFEPGIPNEVTLVPIGSRGQEAAAAAVASASDATPSSPGGQPE